MPAIGDMAYGYDTEGVGAYLDAIKSESLNKAKDAIIEGVKDIQTCCENEWSGKAQENFITNLNKDARHVANQFETLYNILVSEINSVNAAMANKDETMINVE